MQNIPYSARKNPNDELVIQNLHYTSIYCTRILLSTLTCWALNIKNTATLYDCTVVLAYVIEKSRISCYYMKDKCVKWFDDDKLSCSRRWKVRKLHLNMISQWNTVRREDDDVNLLMGIIKWLQLYWSTSMTTLSNYLKGRLILLKTFEVILRVNC